MDRSWIISGYAAIAYLAEIYILPTTQSQGLGKWMVPTIKSHPSFQAIRHWELFTADAHEPRYHFGFSIGPTNSERLTTWCDPTYKTLVVRQS